MQGVGGLQSGVQIGDAWQVPAERRNGWVFLPLSSVLLGLTVLSCMVGLSQLI